MPETIDYRDVVFVKQMESKRAIIRAQGVWQQAYFTIQLSDEAFFDHAMVLNLAVMLPGHLGVVFVNL